MTVVFLAAAALILFVALAVLSVVGRVADELTRIRFLLAEADRRDRERDERAAGTAIDFRPVR